MLWPDAAKGFSIVLVVLTHLTSKHYGVLDLPIPETLHLFWLGFSDVLAPVRMPLFFAISGYFVRKYFQAPFATGIGRRIWAGYYLYLLWYILHSFFFSLEPPLVTNTPSNVNEFAIGLVWGYSSLWYLYSLPLYFLLCRVVQHWKPQALIGAAVLSILSSTAIAPQLGNSASVIGNLVFFMAFAYYPQILGRIGWVSGVRFWSSLAIFGFMSLLRSGITYFVWDSTLEPSLLYIVLGPADLILGFLGIVVGTRTFMVVAERGGRLINFLGYIGRNTLPIYVLHLPVLAALNLILIERWMPPLLAVLYPVLALVCVVGVCLLIFRLLLSLRLDWLFRVPVRKSSHIPLLRLRAMRRGLK